MEVVVSGLSKTYAVRPGAGVQALRDISLTVADGEFVCLLGPSGCGKSTLLKLLAGIETADAGSVLFDGAQRRGASPERGFVFQDYALFPWLTVSGNIGFGLRGLGLPRSPRRELVERYMALLGLSEAAALYPKQLSGGMSQRVALARALCLQPRLLLLDEPFAALDAILRQKLQEELVRLWQEERRTFILVTHDVEEAIYLADRIVVMAPGPGRIQELVSVRLPRPRLRTEPGFVALRRRLLRALEQGEPAEPAPASPSEAAHGVAAW